MTLIPSPTPGVDPHNSSYQDPSIAQGTLSSAQVPGSPNYNSPYAAVIPADVKLTREIYFASFPAIIGKSFNRVSPPGLREGTANTFIPPTPADMVQAALTLATQGYSIDWNIMAMGDDPVITMLMRSEEGVAIVPALFSNAPIKTSLDPADYPPFYPPAPPVAEQIAPANVIGNFEGSVPAGTFSWLSKGGGLFGPGPGARAAIAAGKVVSGQPFTEGAMTVIPNITAGLFGETIVFGLPTA